MNKKTSSKNPLSGLFSRGANNALTPMDKGGEVAPAGAAEVDRFLDQVNRLPAAPRQAGGRGRLMFAMDATMSRQPTWDLALGIQADMFREVARLGGLDVQLVFFRGFGQCRAGKWVSDAEALARLMTRVECQGGRTQIGKVLRHALKEAENRPIGALVLVGDAMEEDADELCDLAGKLSIYGTPLFMFLEGPDPAAELTFREMARLSKGAFCRFEPGAAEQLRALLAAAAVYASGGARALRQLASSKEGVARLLLTQIKPE